MFCPKCGKEIPDDVTYCPYCGSKVKETTSSDDPYADPKPIYVQPAVQPAGQTDNSTYHVLSILALVFSILGGWLGFVFALIGLINDKKKEDRVLCWVAMGLCLVWIALYIVWIVYAFQHGTVYYYN